MKKIPYTSIIQSTNIQKIPSKIMAHPHPAFKSNTQLNLLGQIYQMNNNMLIAPVQKLYQECSQKKQQMLNTFEQFLCKAKRKTDRIGEMCGQIIKKKKYTIENKNQNTDKNINENTNENTHENTNKNKNENIDKNINKNKNENIDKNINKNINENIDKNTNKNKNENTNKNTNKNNNKNYKQCRQNKQYRQFLQDKKCKQVQQDKKTQKKHKLKLKHKNRKLQTQNTQRYYCNCQNQTKIIQFDTQEQFLNHVKFIHSNRSLRIYSHFCTFMENTIPYDDALFICKKKINNKNQSNHKHITNKSIDYQSKTNNKSSQTPIKRLNFSKQHNQIEITKKKVIKNNKKDSDIHQIQQTYYCAYCQSVLQTYHRYTLHFLNKHQTIINKLKNKVMECSQIHNKIKILRKSINVSVINNANIQEHSLSIMFQNGMEESLLNLYADFSYFIYFTLIKEIIHNIIKIKIDRQSITLIHTNIMQQSNPNILDYVQYLQNLLSNYNIPFQSHQQYIHSKTFHKQEQLSQNQSKQKPLQTTLLPQLSSSNFLRYSRQMLLKQIGYNNQIKIIKSKVAIVGSGGIGCPVALYLAGAGIGQIGLFDSDTVQITNLHRQIAHKNKNIGKKKTTSLKQALLQFNPTLTIRQHSNITLQSINELDYYDLIIDGSDNPQCRYLLNDYVKSKNISKKLLSGACIGWEAQITCYSHFVQQDSSQKSTACYRCLWGNQQKPTGGCAAQGVIGMLPGIVGLILGVQALKILTQGKSSLEGQLLTYDGRTCSFRKMKLRGPKQDCIMCGENKIDMMDYNYNFHNQCSMNEPPKDAPSISWTEYFKQNISSILLDVRPSAHFKMVSLVNSKNIPFEDLITMQKQELQEKLKENDLNQKIYTMCRAGINSKKATNFLIDHGIDAVSIQGGINQYADKFDADLPQL